MLRGGNVEWGFEAEAGASRFSGERRRGRAGCREVRRGKTSWPREGRSKGLECRLVSWANRVPNRYTRSKPLHHPLSRDLWFRYDLKSNWLGFYRSRAMNSVVRCISNPFLQGKQATVYLGCNRLFRFSLFVCYVSISTMYIVNAEIITSYLNYLSFPLKRKNSDFPCERNRKNKILYFVSNYFLLNLVTSVSWKIFASEMLMQITKVCVLSYFIIYIKHVVSFFIEYYSIFTNLFIKNIKIFLSIFLRSIWKINRKINIFQPQSSSELKQLYYKAFALLKFFRTCS